MSIAAHIKGTFQLPNFVVENYLADLSDAELMVRPRDGMNHIAWQLGHLICGENYHISQMYPHDMPALPDGFQQQHSKEAAASDNPADFATKEQYLRLMHEQRDGTLEILAGLSDEALLAPSPESLQYFGPTVGSVFAGESAHWMMHAGQWAVVRRKLGRPPLF